MVNSTPPNHDASSQIDEIVDRFLNEYRSGNSPDITAYCLQSPQLADQLRSALSMAALLEEARASHVQSGIHSVRPLRERLGDYRLVREAGSGGMGVVYEAIQESLGRRVALKTLRIGLERGSLLERFLREARAVASLHHTNIVPVFAVDQDQGIHYYVMPFIDGVGLDKALRDLRTLAYHSGLVSKSRAGWPDTIGERTLPALSSDSTIADPTDPRGTGEHVRSDPSTEANEYSIHELFERWKRSQLSSSHSSARFSSSAPKGGYWQLIASIGWQVADALHYAEQQGVLHRDIKPSNLLLDRDGIVWVTDFGLAKVSHNSELTPMGEMLGTLKYLAPERLRGVHEHRGDVYSLGLTLYELATLSIPFHGDDKAELITQIEHQEPTRPRKIDPKIPSDLETIIQKAISKDPNQRYASSKLLAEDLRLFLDDRPIHARRAGMAECSWRWCRRNRVISSLSACIAVLLIASIAVLSVKNARIVRETNEKSIALAAKETAYRQRENAYRVSRASELLAKSRFYAAQVNLAGQAFHNGEVTRAEDLLGSVVPTGGALDFRGFEWHYLIGSLHRGLKQTLHCEGREVTCMSFAPDGNRLLVAGGNDLSGFAYVFDVDSGKRLFEQTEFGCNVNGCAYSPDASMFALALGDGRLLVFSADSKLKIHREETGLFLKSLAWSRDGKLLVAGSERGQLQLWQTPSFRSVSIPDAHAGPILRVFFSRDSSRLYSSADWGGEGIVSHRWDATVWPPVRSLSYPARSITDESPDGRTLAGMNWGTLQLTDPQDGHEIASQSISTGPLVSAMYHQDGNALLVAARTDRTVRKYDPTSLQPTYATGQSNSVSALAVGPAGRYWAAGDSKGEVRIWELKSPRGESQLHDPHIKLAFFLPGQQAVLLAGTGTAQLWRDDEDSTKPFGDVVNLRAISRDGKTWACISTSNDDAGVVTIHVWRDGFSKALDIELAGPIYEQCLAVSATGRWLAIRTEGMPLELYDLSKTPPTRVQSLDAAGYHVAFSPDERSLVCGEQFGVVSCFEVATGNKLANFAEFDSFWAWGMSVSFSPDSQYVASGNESGTIRVWETESKRLVNLLSGQPGEIRSIVFFPDNRRIAVGGTGDVRIWDFQSAQELLSLPVEGGRVESLALNAEGNALVAVTPTGSVRIWRGQAEQVHP